MQRVQGIGGIFFQAKDPKTLLAWYQKVLGLKIEPWGGAFFEFKNLNPVSGAGTVWCPFAEETKYFAPSNKPFMFNFIVDDLAKMLAQAKAAGATVEPQINEEDNGRFGWLMDPEGNRIELWQPWGPK